VSHAYQVAELEIDGHPCDDREPSMNEGSTTRRGESTESDGATSRTDSFLRAVAHVEEIPLSGPAAELVGARLGRYHLVGLLGQGGMGVVYLAEDESLHREVALKVLPADFEKDEERRRRLLREARAAAAVTHPNIAVLHDVGEENGRLYIAMERVEGKSLREALGRGRLPVHEAVGIARQVLRGLSRAHEAGFVHRDLKPDNICVSDEGHVKILDFGLAKRQKVDGADAALESAETLTHATATEAGRLLGTPAYMSPEQARGEAGLSRRSDIFSFGIVLYELLSGKRPFEGRTPADVITSILRDTPPPLSSVDKAIPTALSRIVERCLVKDQEGRYADCKAILDELDGSRVGERPDRGSKARSAVWMAVLGVVGLLVAGAVLWRTRNEFVSSPPSPSASVAPAPRPTAMTDLPLPASKSPEALLAYAQGMQAWRDANGGQALECFNRAVALDPSLAIAHLRAAWLQSFNSPDESLASFARAVQGRNGMSERDRVLLDALEPSLGRKPSNNKLLLEQLYRATERYPLDAELFDYIAYMDENGERRLRAANRATELDPLFANSWQAKGAALVQLGRMEESLQALDHCIAIAPFSADCLAERATTYSMLGRCTEMEADLRRAVTAVPRAMPGWHTAWAMALRATGQPPEAVLTALARKWERYPEQDRRWIELVDRASLDVEDGRFDEAEKRLLEANRLAVSDLRMDTHAQIAIPLASIYWHTGQSRKRAAVAQDFLKRRGAWTRRTQWDDRTMWALSILLQEGAISPNEFSARRSEWLAGARREHGDDPLYEWLQGSLLNIRTEDEARQALAAMAAVPRELLDPRVSNYPGDYAVMYALAGRTDEAVPLLRRALSQCWMFSFPGGRAHLQSLLGQALEKKGDKSGACTEYRQLLDRWGHARPRSVFAEKARERSKALGCGK
jgi:serine/threonine protein kinase/tetratricopeptide (TPR) repeat protein